MAYCDEMSRALLCLALFRSSEGDFTREIECAIVAISDSEVVRPWMKQ